MTPPHIQPLLDAALCLFAILVQSAVSTLGMIFNCLRRDWHTTQTHEPLPQATSGIHFGKQSLNAQHRDATLHDPANQHILRDDRFAIPQDEAGWRRKELVTTPTTLILRDRTHACLNSGSLTWRSSRRMCWESPLPVIPAEARQREEREPRGYARRPHTQLLGSRVRGNDSARA